ncbi:MAG: serine/threonine protein kinase [Kiritimatiellae bacterium]|nr:serine/threonine protein kinase [Kiritimatiellia bacterium]
MEEKHVHRIATELNVPSKRVAATAALLEDGATVPFIARYRKEATGQLDEVAIAQIRDRLARLADVDRRREAILVSLRKRGLLTEELQVSIESAETLAALEDLYLPFRPKRRTRATIARERGLEPLAKALFEQSPRFDPDSAAAAFVDPQKAVPDRAAALAGARDIVAEWINEDPDTRRDVRKLYEEEGRARSKVIKGAEEKGAKFRDYFDWSEPVARAPSHRILAMLRGEKEGALQIQVRPSAERALSLLYARFVKGQTPSSREVAVAVEDSYKRLLAPSLETETRASARERAEEEAIRVFAENLRELLMASPLGRKAVMAIDPGFRTGGKLVCLDPQGKLQFHAVVYPTHSDRQAEEAAELIVKLCGQFRIEAIAIGNGTGGRETEAFVRKLDLPREIAIVLVNESGASVYSASDVARQEFPDHDVTVRGAVSIGRRLMDPLAELVKIDPKSIGVGQYQHDVDQGRLKRGLDDVVMECVNKVGVEANTASRQLLAYVAGLGDTLAGNIVAYRDKNGPFERRSDLKKVPRLGAKAFEQAAGFLRIRDSANPLDASAVHPECYALVTRMARDVGCGVRGLMSDAAARKRIQLESYRTDSVGMPTLQDIMDELARPGRDPREHFEAFSFAEGVTSIGQLTPGMELPGIVTNVTRFGAFVDIGVHQDGLVHISELADRYVNDPAEVVRVQQKVKVTVLEIDLERNRISLSMRAGGRREPDPPAPRRPDPEPDPEPPRRPAPGEDLGSLGSAFEALSVSQPPAEDAAPEPAPSPAAPDAGPSDAGTDERASGKAADFQDLVPDAILDAVEEALGKRTAGLPHALPSYINRVYEVQTSAGDPVIVKFYRPGRWSREALQDEHDYVMECAADEIPVIAPLQRPDGGTLYETNGITFTLFPKRFGRQLEINTDEDWLRVGRLLGRVHGVGSRRTAAARTDLHPARSTAEHVRHLSDGGFVTPKHLAEFQDVTGRILGLIAGLFTDIEFIRIHGDCHCANLLDRPGEGILMIDFDDMMVGPPVQDLWLLLPDRADACRRELNLLLRGYEEFREFDERSLRLIEPLRAMRIIYFLAWCSRQVNDHKFRATYPEWGRDAFWAKEVSDLEAQLQIIRDHL